MTRRVGNKTLGAVAAVGLAALAMTYVAPLLKPAGGDVRVGSDGWLYPAWVRLASGPPGLRALDRLTKVDAMVTAGGGRLFVLVVPEKLRVMEPSRADASAYAALLGGLRTRRLRVLDAAPILAGELAQGESPFQKTDAHWTSEAAERVAASSAEAILASGSLAGRPGDGERPGPWLDTPRYGDLVEIQRRHGDLSREATTFHLRAWTDPPAGPPAVHVVGNSFSDRQYGMPQALSRALDRRVAHYVAYGQAGPWRAMEAFVAARPDLAGEVVVWQVGEGGLVEGP